jgi:D-serine deaminase-like pyridoxal phosphate-dependent protein
MPLDEVDTPALIVDLDALEANIAHMQSRVAHTQAYLRPHAKTHKSVNIARLQVAGKRRFRTLPAAA